MPKGLYIPVGVGLVEGRHFRDMREAIFTYLWLLNKETAEMVARGIVFGLVAGGKQITAQEIASNYLGMLASTARRHLLTLEENGYILSIRRPAGRTIWVRKSRRGLVGKPLAKKQRRDLFKELARRSPTLFNGIESDSSIPELPSKKRPFKKRRDSSNTALRVEESSTPSRAKSKAKPLRPKASGKSPKPHNVTSNVIKKIEAKKKPSLSEVTLFKEFAKETYQEKMEDGLLVKEGKDGKLIKDMLAVEGCTLEKLKRWWTYFLSRDWEIKGTVCPHTIGVFYGFLPTIVEVGKRWGKSPFPKGTKIISLYNRPNRGIKKGDVGKRVRGGFMFGKEYIQDGSVLACPTEWKVELPAN